MSWINLAQNKDHKTGWCSDNALKILIHEVLSSNLSQNTNYHEVYMVFLSLSRQMLGLYLS
ncbi:hypothetical protein B7P43_G13340 [Cryptotermes secundus]|uniref:Uncharacterized protein n=1 Tax=Cryptotermes secundus TaxID=105785 RepID=A0A2J7R705_9NEOP|nr:hypothetical protein B7P43_G13340 [Cryptotermes secundus]